jgi:predicted transposase/invertase (TIGR01784 family)
MPSGKRLKANRKYKSSLFASYFSETNQRLIGLYNAFLKVEYPADTPLEVNTLDSALFYGLINDISFVLDNMLIVLIEHQSSFNPNMPFRILLYIAEILKRRYNDPRPFYMSALQQIEKVRCLVLYNGTEDRPDKSIIRLSDAFKKVTDDIGDPELDIQLELVVPVYNISLGKNPEILAKSKPLLEYSQFIAKVNEELASGKDRTQAVEAAIKYCREHNIMADYLKTHETEVRSVLMQELSARDIAEVKYSEGIEKGRTEGLTEGVISVARNALARGMSITDIADITGLTRNEIENLRNLY